MEIKEFIKIYDNVMSLEPIANFVKFCNTINFKEQSVLTGGKDFDKLNKKIRSANGYDLRNDRESLTEAHWCNIFLFILKKALEKYDSELPCKTGIKRIYEVNVLKYNEGDFYVAHTDSHFSVPRALSVIMFLNDDYEGGEVIFHCPKSMNPMITVKPKAGKLIIFPSNFLYPHSVTKVTKGVRYSIVSWMI